MIFLSNFQTNTILHPVSAPNKDQDEPKLEAKKVPTGTVFMGPLSHREETVDSILRSQASGAWSEEMEAQYMESVRNKATAKVRAMLLQAKRRGDEIIAEAEVAAQQVIDQAHAMHAQVLEQQAQIQGQFEEAYGLGTQKAMEDVQNILAQNQKALGESTAVVLLSIHQQLQKFYDVWREELRLLTLEAIKVGSGWVGDGKKEEILADMLDECVRKMVEKTKYTVRVHPSDGALVSQVLENSKEKDWTMETSNELEPGSLELEGTHALVKNQSGDRKRFVQEILDELILPKKPEEAHIVQNVTDTLMGEMANNPLLAQNTHENIQPENIPSENILPENSENMPQENMMPETSQPVASHIDMPINAEQEISSASDALNTQAQEITEFQELANNDEMQTQEAFHNEGASNTPHTEPENSQERPQQNKQNPARKPVQKVPPIQQEAPTPHAPQIDANAEAQDLVDSFLADSEEPIQAEINQDQANTQSTTKQETETGENILPPNIADDLLSEMGFGDDTPQ